MARSISLLIFGVYLLLAMSSVHADIRIHGGDSALQGNIHAHLDSLAREPCDVAHWRLQRYRKQLALDVNKAAQSLGYYQLKHKAQWSKTDKCWLLELTIEPGLRSKIASIQFTLQGDGQHDPLLINLQRELNLRVGQELDHGLYEKAKTNIQKALQNYGYWQGKWVETRLLIDDSKNQADIILTLDTGPIFYFGTLYIPQSDLDNDLIRRLADLPEGEVFTKPRMNLAYERLQSTPYFSSVLLRPSFDAEQTHVDTRMALNMANKYQFSTGIGYSSDQGPRLSARLDDNYVNSAGHTWTLATSWSEDLSETKFNYRVPLKDPADQWLDNQLGYNRETTDSYNSRTFTSGVRYVEKFNEQWNWFGALSFQRDLYNLVDQDDEESNLVIPSLGINTVVLDNATNTRLGLRLESEILGSSDKLLSDTRFL